MSTVFVPAPPLPPGRPNLVVTGFMGTGKTEAGRRAASLLDLPFVDLDRVAAGRAGRPVAGLVEDDEPAFRRLEREVVTEASLLSGTVVATGGGAPTDEASYRLLATGAVAAVLTCREDVLLDRLGDGKGRPLLRPDPPRRVAELLRDRAPSYAAAGQPLDTTALSPAGAGAELATRYRRSVPGGAPLRLSVPPSTSVLIGPGCLDQTGRVLSEAVPGARTAVVVADEAVAAGPARRVAEALGGAGHRTVVVPVPAGEAAKQVRVVAGLWDRFREAGLERSDAVVAVGGGATLDAAGFAAATYARGVAHLTIPTTLLAMVDASVGGKTAIDHAGTKNLAGAFHHPRAMIADPDVLATLDPRQVRGGLAEAVKAFALASPLALEVLETGEPDLPWVMEQALRVKAAYVSADPEDRGARVSLNLGHTFAHAVEAATAHAVPHGDAVAIGLVAAARLGTRAGLTPEGSEAALAGVLAALGLPTRPPRGLDPGTVAEAMAGDKKRRSGRPVFVVPSPGGAHLVRDVGVDQALDALFAGARP
jgi:shikimate kinase / 3-dehydroquinate synthase